MSRTPRAVPLIALSAGILLTLALAATVAGPLIGRVAASPAAASHQSAPARRLAGALSPRLTPGAVIDAVNHTGDAVALLGGQGGVVHELALVDVTPLFPPNPCDGGSCRIAALEEAIGHQASAVVALREELLTARVSVPDCAADCSPITVAEYLAGAPGGPLALDQVVTTEVLGLTLRVYVYHPPDPCIQDPSGACPSGDTQG